MNSFNINTIWTIQTLADDAENMCTRVDEAVYAMADDEA